MTYRQRLAEHLRLLLKIHGYKKKDVAFALGYTAAWTSKVLRDERPISTDDLPKVAAFFGLSVDEFVAPGLSTVTERRKTQRRHGERRKSHDRRHLDTRSWTVTQRRIVEASDRDRPAPLPADREEWTPAQRAAAGLKMKGDPLTELPSRHGEYFRPLGTGERRAPGEATARSK